VALPSSPGPRMRARLRRDTVRWLLWLALAATGSLLIGIWAGAAAVTPTARPADTTSGPTVPAACRDAVRLAARLAPNAAAVAVAAHRHAELMDRLDLFLEGEPGGLSGRQVYEQGETQMRVFEQRAPTLHRQAQQLQEVARRCPP
jgi:hypothetical protein